MTTLVDTNILIDISARDPVWLSWSRRQLEIARRQGSIIINQIIFAEFSLRFASLKDVELVLPADEFRREGLPWAAAFAAAKAFDLYRSGGGKRDMILPDFLIGAHAAIRGYHLLTRDLRRYRTYFPNVELISPETHP